MAVKPPSEAPTLSGHLDVYLFEWQSESGGHTFFHKFRRLDGSDKFRFVRRYVGEEVHRFQRTVGEERGRVAALDDLCCIFEGRFRVAVPADDLCQFGAHFRHFCHMILGVFQAGWNFYVIAFTREASHHDVLLRRCFPLDFQRFFGIHHFPGRVACHDHELVESVGVAPLASVVLFVCVDDENVFNAGHGPRCRVVHRFQFHAKSRCVRNHGDEHAFPFVVQSEQRLPRHDFLTVHIFSGGADDFEVLYFFQLYLLRYGNFSGGRGHFAITRRFTAAFMM